MNRTHIIMGLLIVLVILFIAMNQKSEHLESSNLSNEAIQNIASVYANTAGEAVFNKIRSTGGITGNVAGDVKGNLTGDVTGNVKGNLEGNVKGNVTGNVKGDVTGNLTGNDVKSRVVKGLEYHVLQNDEKNTHKWIQVVDKEGNLLFAPNESTSNDWNWGKQIVFTKNGDILYAGIIKRVNW